MKIKIDRADKMFSLYVRERDGWTCQRCRRRYDRDEANALQASHFFGRGNENTRFDPDNVVALCMGCHMRWGGANHEEYRDWMIQRLGDEGFKKLKQRSAIPLKKDRKLAAIAWGMAYRQLCKEKNLKPRV